MFKQLIIILILDYAFIPRLARVKKSGKLVLTEGNAQNEESKGFVVIFLKD